jgi:hypothetical protein
VRAKHGVNGFVRLDVSEAVYTVHEIGGRHLSNLNDEAISYGHLLAMPAEVERPAERLRCLAF